MFHKGRTLYNFARARRAAQSAGTLVAVEGYMDVIALSQAGIDNAVAPLGTALTEDQLDMLLRAADEPILSFDGDAAGVRAAHRVIELALPRLKPGKSVRFALLPSGQDPDDVVRKGGREAFDAMLAQARPLADMLWSRETQGGTFDTPERRAELEGNLKRLTQMIADETVRRHYAQDMRDRLQAFFGPARGAEPRRGGARPGQGGPGGQRHGAAAGRMPVSESLARSALLQRGEQVASLREAAICVAAINHPQLVCRDIEQFEGLGFTQGPLAELGSALLDVAADNPTPDRAAVLAEIEARGISPQYAALEQRVRNARLWTVLGDAAPDDAAVFLEQAIGLHRRIHEIQTELRHLEREVAESGSDESFAMLVSLRAELHRLEQAEALVEGFGLLSGRVHGRG